MRCVFLLLVLSQAACFGDVPTDGAPCPCAEGWVCCASNDICAEDVTDCPRDEAPEPQAAYVGKVDVLLVVDNSVGMKSEAPAVHAELEKLATRLKAAKIDYRMGITSTDYEGSYEDCDGMPFGDGPRGVGNCDRREVLLDPFHDGTLGRLISAHDPQAFLASNYPMWDDVRDALELLWRLETPSVLEGRTLRRDACWACNCDVCAAGNECFDGCASKVEDTLGQSYLRSNLAGLGFRGSGYESGIATALLAVGIDPREPTDAGALNPTDGLLRSGAANTYRDAPWIRDDAALVVLFVSDEDDCSLPAYLAEPDLRAGYEEDAGNPVGSICYQDAVGTQFLDIERMSDLLEARKDCPGVATGFLGGVTNTGGHRTGSDCTDFAAAEDAQICSCIDLVDLRWCEYTQYTSDDGFLPQCTTLAGDRYVDFLAHSQASIANSMCDDPSIFVERAAALISDAAAWTCD